MCKVVVVITGESIKFSAAKNFPIYSSMLWNIL